MLELGTQVKINVEATAENYWEGLEEYKNYILAQPDKIYTIVRYSNERASAPYVLDDIRLSKTCFYEHELIVTSEANEVLEKLRKDIEESIWTYDSYDERAAVLDTVIMTLHALNMYTVEANNMIFKFWVAIEK